MKIDREIENCEEILELTGVENLAIRKFTRRIDNCNDLPPFPWERDGFRSARKANLNGVLSHRLQIIQSYVCTFGQTRSMAITRDQLCKLRPGYLTRPVHTRNPIAFNRDASSKQYLVSNQIESCPN